jgi:excisionase family DNA binding protein
MERLYTLKEAKRLLGVTTKTIQRWDKEGKVRVVRTVGGRRRIPESEIKRILGLKEERVVVGYGSLLQLKRVTWRGRSSLYTATLKRRVVASFKY